MAMLTFVAIGLNPTVSSCKSCPNPCSSSSITQSKSFSASLSALFINRCFHQYLYTRKHSMTKNITRADTPHQIHDVAATSSHSESESLQKHKLSV
eukprot:331915_1